MNRLSTSKQSFSQIIESGKKHITKASLRKFILSLNRDELNREQTLRLTRLDCHLLVKMLFQENQQNLREETNP
jgi:hypothetical protein